MSISTKNPTTSMSTESLGNSEIQKGFNLLGLKLSESEMDELKHGNTISLENRRLSEIGSVLILAEALSSLHSVKHITFKDLPEIVTKSLSCSGIPVHHWDCDILGKCYLLLTSINGKPAVKISYQQ